MFWEVSLVSTVWIAFTFLINSSYTDFFLHYLAYLNQQEQFLTLTISDFKLTKLTYLADFDVSMPIALLESDFLV